MLIQFRQHGQGGNHPRPMVCIVKHGGEALGFLVGALAGSDAVDHQLNELAVLHQSLFVVEGPCFPREVIGVDETHSDASDARCC